MQTSDNGDIYAHASQGNTAVINGTARGHFSMTINYQLVFCKVAYHHNVNMW